MAGNWTIAWTVGAKARPALPPQTASLREMGRLLQVLEFLCARLEVRALDLANENADCLDEWEPDSWALALRLVLRELKRENLSLAGMVLDAGAQPAGPLAVLGASGGCLVLRFTGRDPMLEAVVAQLRGSMANGLIEFDLGEVNPALQDLRRYLVA